MVLTFLMVGLMAKSIVELRERIQRERNQREVIITLLWLIKYVSNMI